MTEIKFTTETPPCKWFSDRHDSPPTIGSRQADLRRPPSSAQAGEGPATVGNDRSNFEKVEASIVRVGDAIVRLTPKGPSSQRVLTPCPRCGGRLEIVADGSINLWPAPFVSCASCEFCEEVVR